MSDYQAIDVTKQAKMIRQALKEAFPEVKFSVRSERYSMGASIDISWTDGPLTRQVDEVVKIFAGATFDGMDDYKGGVIHELEGEQLSPEVRRSIAAQHNFGPQEWHEGEGCQRLAWLIAMNSADKKFDGRQSATAAKLKIVRKY